MWTVPTAATAATPAMPGSVYLFHHISKAGGASLARDVAALEPVRSCEPTHCLHAKTIDELSGLPTPFTCDCSKYRQQPERAGCNFFACEGSVTTNLAILKNITAAPVRLIVMLREPVAHAVSMYSHCQSRGSDGMRSRHYEPIGLEELIAIWASGNRSQTGLAQARHCGYAFDNRQTAQLGGDVSRAMRLIDEADVVGTTDEYAASLCLLTARLGARLPPACTSCRAAAVAVSHVTHRTDSASIGIPGGTLSQLRALTRRDALLHARASARLQRDLERRGMGCLLWT